MRPYIARHTLLAEFGRRVRSSMAAMAADVGDYPGRDYGLSDAEKRALEEACDPERIQYRFGEAVDHLPAYRVSFHVTGEDTSLGRHDGKRRTVYSGELLVECMDTNRTGERGLYLMAEAATDCMQNRTIPASDNSGDVVVYSATQGDALTRDDADPTAVSLAVRFPVEFEHRR